MRMKVIKTSDGGIIGISAVLPPHLTPGAVGHGPVRAEVVAGPNQHIEEVEVPDAFAAIHNGEELHNKLKEHLVKRHK
jgi:hypothetical protein